MLFKIVLLTRTPREPWIDFNRRLARFSFAVVRAARGQYAAWIVGAATRMLGRSFVTNLPAASEILIIAVAWPWRLFRTGGDRHLAIDVPVLAVLAILWLVGAGSLTMLMIAPSTPGISRRRACWSRRRSSIGRRCWCFRARRKVPHDSHFSR